MKTPKTCFHSGAAVLFALVVATQAEPAKITVAVDKSGHKIPPTLWGIFFEDINLSADGGIYPELVRNRSFEDSSGPEFWESANVSAGKSEFTVAASDEHAQPPPLNPFNRKSLCVKADGGFAIENGGYWGMNIVSGETYNLKLAARTPDNFNTPLKVKVLSSSGNELASGEISVPTRDWKYHSLELTAKGGDAKAKLQISGDGKGTLFVDMVSLMPKKTWKDHGLRADLCESLDAMKPAFVRFPGGCWVEGDDFAHMYKWKNTIGDIDARVPLWNIWKYNATHGLGFHEYLQISEDLGATPLFCINVGMSHKEVVPLDKMDQWVQDALDAIEYANGPTNSLWGARRTKAGHPAPFNLRYLEIGNENGDAPYRERWPLFVKAIKEKHPDIQLIANHWHGSYPREPKPDIVDEHYYNTPEFFMQQANRYDRYERNGPKIFVGEYAVTRNGGKGNLRAAIGEAAFMTGLERNSDVVIMASYAPLFVNLNHRAWPVNLINFDNANWFGLPGYYVQKLFSIHRGDVLLPTTVETGVIEEKPPGGRIGVGTWNTQAEFKDIKVTAPDGKVLFQSDFTGGASSTSPKSDQGVAELRPPGWKLLGGGEWKVSDGALQQTAEKEFVRALAGDKSWTDYTLELKARKIAGREGFIILFHVQDDDDRVWWNIGGWRNTQHGIELGETLDPKRGSVETGRWYDIKIELRGARVRCWLDGNLVHDVRGGPLRRAPGLFASATRDDKTGEVILKIVNSAATPTETEINLTGVKQLASSAQAIVLTSEKPTDENSLEEPMKVSPKTETLNIAAPKFTRAFPGNSLTVLRIGTEK